MPFRPIIFVSCEPRAYDSALRWAMLGVNPLGIPPGRTLVALGAELSFRY